MANGSKNRMRVGLLARRLGWCSRSRSSSAHLAAVGTTVRRPALPPKSAARDGFVSDGGGRKQELLWRQFFLDPSMWWDNRRDKKSAHSPDFRRKGSGEVLWLQDFSKPAWVDEQLDALDMQLMRAASVSTSSLPEKSDPGRHGRWELGATAVTVRSLCQQGKLPEAVGALEFLAQARCPIPQSLLYIVLKTCAARKDLATGRQVHDLAVKLGYESDTYLGNHILRMYALGGMLQEAMDVFTRVGEPNAFMWFSIISAHAKHGKPHEAIQLYHEMRSLGGKADAHVFVAALQACAFGADLESGRKVHTDVLNSGIPPNFFVGSCLVDMYAKCGELVEARRVFDSLVAKNVVTWNSLIGGYANLGLFREALSLYEQMEQDGLTLADRVTFACLLKACAAAGALQEGKQLHSQIMERGQLQSDTLVGNCLVDMYAKCGELGEARRVFDSLATKDVVSCTALIAGYVQQGLCQDALLLFGHLEEEGLIFANHVTFTCLLKACASTGALQKGRKLHSQIAENGMLHSDILVGNCLVDMYAKCGELEDARRVFDSLSIKNVVTWTALLAGYTQQGLCQEALVLYTKMEQEGLILGDSVTFSCLLKACASAGALQKGRQLHSQIVERGLLNNLVVGSSLVDMYGKCGELQDARRVFDCLATKDVVTWNALIAAYGTCGGGHKALASLEEMFLTGVRPDDTTFTCLLVACSHEGLVNEGLQLFDAMVEQHGIIPTIEHHACMVDLLGRAGHLDEAENMLLSCESQNDVVGLTSLLNACRSHGDVERAKRSFERLVKVDPQRASAYVLMANVYADAGRWADVERIEAHRMVAGANKKPAVAGIEIMEQVHTFVVGENRDDISRNLENLNVRLKEEGGHLPQTKLVLKPLSEKEKNDVLCGHAEKLALAFGLLNTPSGTPLLVTKNLRMCSDCHSSTEILSRVEKREIVVRDGYRVHRFAAGSCSCKGRP